MHLTEIEVDARVEQTAEDRVHDDHREVVGVIPWKANVANPQLGLRRIGLGDDDQRAAVSRAAASTVVTRVGVGPRQSPRVCCTRRRASSEEIAPERRIVMLPGAARSA